jgi:hypothetical protein
VTLPRDKLQHLAMGLGAAAVTLLAIWLAQWQLGAAVALVCTAFGGFYEWQQGYRGEGQVDLWDAAATAAPGWLAWAALASLPPGILT